MAISQALLGRMLIGALLTGAVWGAWYDVLRLFRVIVGLEGDCRRAGRKKRLCHSVVLFVQDVLFGVIGGVSLVLLLYYTNDGQFRGLAVIGMLLGACVYHQTIGRGVRFCTDKAIGWLKRLLRRMARWMCKPFRGVYRRCQSAIRMRRKEKETVEVE